MPGENCAIFGCGTCRNQSIYGIFKIPSPKDDFNKKWREEMLSLITRDRIVDAKFKLQIEKNRVFICEKHFAADQLYYCKCSYHINNIVT